MQMIKALLTMFGLLVAFMASIAALIAVVWQIYWIDDTVTTGEAYGYTIGTDREEVFHQVKFRAKEENYYAFFLGSEGPGYINMDDVTLSMLDESANYKNFWSISLGELGSHPNLIRLYFENNKLAKIYRHRQWLELP